MNRPRRHIVIPTIIGPAVAAFCVAHAIAAVVDNAAGTPGSVASGDRFGLTPLTTAEVEGGAGVEPADLPDQSRVGSTAPPLALPAVPVLP